MGRRDLFRTLDLLLARSFSSQIAKRPQHYGRYVRQFSSVNQQKNENVGKNAGEDNNTTTNNNNKESTPNQNNPGKLSRRELQLQREADFVREFNEIHNHFFGNLPLRRYAHFDGFSALDRIFNQEFNRIRNQFFLNDNSTAGKDKQQSKAATSENNCNSDKATNQQAGESTTAKAQTDQACKNQAESQSVAKQQQELHDNLNHFFDVNSFFSSPRYISDVGDIFKKEQQRLTELTKAFEDSFRSQENNPGARTIRRVYRSDPDGEVREFYDSKNPERNYKFERKFDRTTGQSTITRQRGEGLVDKNQQQDANTTNAQAESKTNNTTADTTAAATASSTTTQTAQTETANTQTSNAETKAATTEDNDKAKKLSFMLKKDYSECLELAKVYQTQSVGQIIDIVLENEGKNAQK